MNPSTLKASLVLECRYRIRPERRGDGTSHLKRPGRSVTSRVPVDGVVVLTSSPDYSVRTYPEPLIVTAGSDARPLTATPSILSAAAPRWHWFDDLG
jgi:hypothetical protein